MTYVNSPVKLWNKLLTALFIVTQIRIETDPADRTQLRMTVASGDPTLTFEYVSVLNPLSFYLHNIWDCSDLCHAG